MGIRKISKKRSQQLTMYSIAREEYFIDNPTCEICSSPLIVLHHKKGRRGERLYDKEFFMSVCNADHAQIHAHPEWSYEKGYLIKG